MSATALHPMLRPRGFTISTAPLKECVEAFQSHADDGESSMYCVAPSRFGKTTVVEHIERTLRANRLAVPMFLHVVNFRERNPSAKFWHSLRTGSVEATSLERYVSRPFDALMNHIHNECDKFQTQRVSFLLDEAQNLTVEQLDMLKYVTESLTKAGLIPFTFLMAQPEILLRPEQLKVAGRHDLVDRFFTRPHRLRGLTREEAKTLCLFYDHACWPEESGISYTRHFVPRLWQHGWRLSQHAEGLWAAFERAARSLHVHREPFEVGAKFLTKSVLHLLSRLTHEPNLRLEGKLFDAAVSDSEFASHLSVVGDAFAAAEHARLRFLENQRQRARGAGRPSQLGPGKGTPTSLT